MNASSLRTSIIIVLFVCSVAKSCSTLCNPMDYIARQAPLSMGFPRQEYWNDLTFSPPGDLPYPGIEPMSPASPALQADSRPAEPPGKSYHALSITKWGLFILKNLYKHLKN